MGKKSKNKKKILYLTAFYPENSGYHWRAKKWAEILEEDGYTVTLLHALDESEFKTLHQSNFNQFLILFLKRRFKQVLLSRSYETVIVQRELLIFNDYGNLFLEKLLLKLHPKAIIDFDDDLSAAKGQPRKITNWFGKIMLENGDKFNETLKMYKHFIVASDYLKQRVLEQHTSLDESNICVIPTCVDYEKYPPKEYPSEIKELTFGWIGGDHNYYLLDRVLPILNELGTRYRFKLLVIGGSPYNRETSFELIFKKWGLETEIDDLRLIDVGLMPLIDDPESRGKGGFKLIQYMGLGIVSIASPVTINNQIIDDTVNSFLAMSDQEWTTVFQRILKKEVDLKGIGAKAREKIATNYTFNANKVNYLQFIERVRNSRDMV